MRLYHTDIQGLELKATLEQWLRAIHPEFAVYVQNYKKPLDRWRVLAGKLLLQYALRNEAPDLKPDKLAYSEKGRPFFEGDFDFNISHSGELAVLATGHALRVGVDVEGHRPLKPVLFKRNFSDREWEHITTSGDELARFFSFWAIKESVIKADGRGFSVLGRTEVLSGSEAVCDGTKWFYRIFPVRKGYAASVASDRAEDLEMFEVHSTELWHSR